VTFSSELKDDLCAFILSSINPMVPVGNTMDRAYYSASFMIYMYWGGVAQWLPCLTHNWRMPLWLKFETPS